MGQRGDLWVPTLYVNGIRYSSIRKGKSDDTNIVYVQNEQVKYGKVLGFLVNSDRQLDRVITSPYLISDRHLERLAIGLCRAGIPRNETQKLIDALCDPIYGAVSNGNGSAVAISIKMIIGHAVLVTNDSFSLLLPFSHRVLSS